MSNLPNAEIRELLQAVTERFPNDEAVAGRVRLIEQNLHRRAGGDAHPDTKRQTTRLLTELGDLIAAASTKTEP
jgi:hypothetical protein